MKTDINDTLRAKGPEAVRERYDQAHKRKTIADIHTLFSKWFGSEYDTATIDAVLAVAAAEKFPGDPPWLLVISGPGNAKTETVGSVSGIPGSVIVSTITSEGALLSGVSKKARAKGSTGGLLRQLGERGILIIKDFTSILSADRNLRSPMLAALREIHDGKWVRSLGSDGGMTYVWEGRIIVLAACTTAWDSAYGVIATMGDRFVTIRSSARTGRGSAGTRALRNTGVEAGMRSEINEAVAALLKTVVPREYPLSDDETNRLVAVADIVTLARTAVETDHMGNVIDAHEPEMPNSLRQTAGDDLPRRPGDWPVALGRVRVGRALRARFRAAAAACRAAGHRRQRSGRVPRRRCGEATGQAMAHDRSHAAGAARPATAQMRLRRQEESWRGKQRRPKDRAPLQPCVRRMPRRARPLKSFAKLVSRREKREK